MAGGRGRISRRARAGDHDLHLFDFGTDPWARCAFLLAAACPLDFPVSAQLPRERPDRSLGQQTTQLDERGGRRGRRGSVDEFRTHVPWRPYDIVLGDPTEASVTASIVAYSPLEGYFE